MSASGTTVRHGGRNLLGEPPVLKGGPVADRRRGYQRRADGEGVRLGRPGDRVGDGVETLLDAGDPAARCQEVKKPDDMSPGEAGRRSLSDLL